MHDITERVAAAVRESGVRSGIVPLGTWQQISYCDFDNRPRSRRVVVQIVGE
jgi:thiamine phosphate synthase YjbQ (UPF0047 family)